MSIDIYIYISYACLSVYIYIYLHANSKKKLVEGHHETLELLKLQKASTWRTKLALLLEAFGAPARAGGVQTLTPLWFGNDQPSEAHIAATVA